MTGTVILNNYRNPALVEPLTRYLAREGSVLVVRTERDVVAAATASPGARVVLSGSERDPRPRFAGLLRRLPRGTVVLAICYGMQCLAMSLGAKIRRVAPAPKMMTHTVHPTGATVVSRHEWGVLASDRVIRATETYEIHGKRVIAAFSLETPRGVRVSAVQYHPEYASQDGGGDLAAALDEHRRAAEWFEIPVPGEVRAVVPAGRDRVVFLDHGPDDDPSFLEGLVPAMERLRARAGAAAAAGLTFVKSGSARPRSLPPAGCFPRPRDVNGGSHFGGTLRAHVLRREGALKVALHEAVHAFGLEDRVVVPESVPGCVCGYESPREAWVETVALVALHDGDPEKMLRERRHALQMCGRILWNAGYRRAGDFLRSDRASCARRDRQGSDVLAYFFLRAALLSDLRRLGDPGCLVRAAQRLGTPAFADEVQRAMGPPTDRSLRMTTVG